MNSDDIANRKSGVDPNLLMGAALFRRQRGESDAANSDDPNTARSLSPKPPPPVVPARPASGSLSLSPKHGRQESGNFKTRPTSGSISSQDARPASNSVTTRPPSNSVTTRPPSNSVTAKPSFRIDGGANGSTTPKSSGLHARTTTPEGVGGVKNSPSSEGMKRPPSMYGGFRSPTSTQLSPASSAIIDSIAAPSDTRLIESHVVNHEKPVGPRKKHASTRQKFTDLVKESSEVKPVNIELVDQVKFVNPLLEASVDGTTSAPVETAIAKLAMDQRKSLKRVVHEDKNKPSDKPLTEAQMALSRLKKVDNSPANKNAELSKMFSREFSASDLKAANSPDQTVKKEQAPEASKPTQGADVESGKPKEEQAPKANGCCVIL